LHATALDEVHTVAACTLSLTRDLPLKPASAASPPPSRVTLVAPVVAPFEARTLLSTGPSNVNTSDTLPTAKPLVIAERCAHTVPDAVLHATELSEVHAVAASPSLPPTRDLPLYPASPTRPPSRVTLVAPVVAVLDANRLLGAGPWNVNTSDTLPTASPLVITPRRAQTVPEAILLATELSEVHVVVSATVTSNRTRLL
jgi:hypothetical protein